jgi:hypothetical protein
MNTTLPGMDETPYKEDFIKFPKISGKKNGIHHVNFNHSFDDQATGISNGETSIGTVGMNGLAGPILSNLPQGHSRKFNSLTLKTTGAITKT